MMMLFFSRCSEAVPVRVAPLGGEDRRSVPVWFDSVCLLLQTWVALGCHRGLCPGCSGQLLWFCLFGKAVGSAGCSDGVHHPSWVTPRVLSSCY